MWLYDDFLLYGCRRILQFIIYGDVFDTPQSDVLFVNIHSKSGCRMGKKAIKNELPRSIYQHKVKEGTHQRRYFHRSTKKTHYLIIIL